MKATALLPSEESWNDELLDLLLDEAERALFVVDARVDDVGRRTLHGDTADRDEEPPAGVGELRLAMAELVDSFPSIHNDLEMISDRVRNVGIKAGVLELESNPHIIDLVRLSLEILFRLYPEGGQYEADQRLFYGKDREEAQLAGEFYEAYLRLLEMLRSRLS